MKRLTFALLIILAGTAHAANLKDMFREPCYGELLIITEQGQIGAEFCYNQALVIKGHGYIVKLCNDSTWVYNEEENYIVLGKTSLAFYRLLTGFDADSMEVSEWKEFDKIRLPSRIALGTATVVIKKAHAGKRECPIIPSPVEFHMDIIDLWY